MSNGNTVGSREVEKLTKRQEDILIGKILGDGCLELNSSHTRVKFDQSIKQKEYIFWLYKEFALVATGNPYNIGYFDKRSKKIYYNYRFSTRSIKLFDSWKTLFYQKGKKVIPRNIAKILKSPLSLAVWYMDDGYRRKDCRGLYLCTSSYKLPEQKLLQDALLRNFAIQTKIHYAAGNMRLYVSAAYYQRFFEIVGKYILPNFSYKLP
jgi:hypothetical protein